MRPEKPSTVSHQLWHGKDPLPAQRPWSLNIGLKFTALYRQWWRLITINQPRSKYSLYLKINVITSICVQIVWKGWNIFCAVKEISLMFMLWNYMHQESFCTGMDLLYAAFIYKLFEKDKTLSALFKNFWMVWNYMHKDVISFGIEIVIS
jgi:hypothetical protein